MEDKAVIGAYTLGKTIGEGTFGKVKLGKHNPTGEKVAIKILEKKKICDVSDVERVSREIHILKLIRHPNIIQLYEIIETPKKLYLIMEYANGGELFEYIVAHTKVKESLACKFFQQLIAGIEYIHKLGVVHRDLKPENLLLDSDNIRIVDFGLSNTYNPSERLKTACGSPCYAAPEMIAGKKYEGLKADIWSAGVILYATVCGYLPFENSDTSKLYKKILAGDYSCPNFISDDVKDLIHRILDTDPDSRYNIEQIRQHPWCQKVHQDIREGILIGYDRINVDPHILKGLNEFGYNVDHIRKCLEANKHNSTTAAYYLLLKKHIQNGGKSVQYEELPPVKKEENKNKLFSYTPHPPMFHLTQEIGNPLLLKFKHNQRRTSAEPIKNNRKLCRKSVDLRFTSNPRTGRKSGVSGLSMTIDQRYRPKNRRLRNSRLSM